MKILMNEKYNQCAVGDSSFVAASETPMDAFAAVYEEAKRMEQEGLIRISCEHHETSTGQRLIDAFKFERLI